MSQQTKGKSRLMAVLNGVDVAKCYQICLILLILPYVMECSTGEQAENDEADFEDEDDVGQTLTLKDEEVDIIIPEEDEVRTDENDYFVSGKDNPEVFRVMKVHPLAIDEILDIPSNLIPPVVQPLSAAGSRTRNRGAEYPTNGERARADKTPADFEEEDVGPAVTRETQVRRPPEIVTLPKPEVAYKPDERVLLMCQAKGDPELIYVWKKDGEIVDFDQSSSLRLLQNGTLEFLRPEDGTFQCFVSNGFGTAVSTKSVVKVAALETFPTVYQPRVLLPVIGSYLKLECQPPRCFPSGNIYWGEVGNDAKLRPIDNSDRITLDYDGNLHFVNIDASDERNAATYVCVVQNPVLRSLAQGSDHRIEVLPRTGGPANVAPELVWSTASATVAIKGQELKMKCIFSGYPTPRVTWRRLDKEIERSTRYSGLNQQELIITDVEHGDEGRYECSATNTASRTPARQEFIVIVESPPYLTQGIGPANVDAVEEDDVRFDCDVSGVPKPTITWTVNGRLVADLPPDSRRTVGDNFLEYRNVTSSDTQVVQCNASNVHGYIFGNAYLIVRAEPPTFIEPLPRETKISKGGQAVLACQANGAPKPTISWTKNSQVVVAESNYVVLHPSGDLEILNARIEDEGVYRCVIRNKFGTDEAEVQLDVRENLVFTGAALESQTIVAPTQVNFRCDFYADPDDMPFVDAVWLKDDEVLNGDSTSSPSIGYSDGEMLLVFDSTVASDSGRYTCRIATELENIASSAQLLVKDRPDPPVNVELSDCGRDSTELSFTPGSSNNDDIIEYTVNLQTRLLAPSSQDTYERTSGTVLAAGPYSLSVPLMPWRNYSFSIYSRNSIGVSDTVTPQQSCLTPPAVPSVNPDRVCAERRSADELVITWKALSVADVNGDGFRYSVTYRRKDVDSSEEITEEVFGLQQSELVVSNQETFKPYEVLVRAVNNQGTSKAAVKTVTVYSGQATATVIPDNIHVVEGSLNSSSVTVAWDPVDQTTDGINGFFVGYQVKYWKSNDPSSEKVMNIEVNPEANKLAMCVTSDDEDMSSRRKRSVDLYIATIDDLWPFTSTSLTVSVINTMGVGQASSPIDFTTREGVPSVVPGLDSTEVGSTHIKLRWSNPHEPNGIVKNYVVNYVDAKGETKAEIVTDQWVSLYDLDPSSSYTISVCAETSAGCSEKTIVNRSTLPLAAPDKPSVYNIATGDSWANVSWQRSAGGGDVKHPAREYHIQFRRINTGPNVTPSTSQWERYGKERDRQWINVTQLSQSVEYAVRVVAVTTDDNDDDDNDGDYKSFSDEKQFFVGPPLLKQGQVEQPPMASASTPTWVIIVILLCIVAVVIVIVAVVFVRRRRRQAKEPPSGKDVPKQRPSDEEKFLSGNSPNSKNESDTRSNSTSPNPLAASSASLISKKSGLGDGNDSDDLDSLADDADVTKFNEDGSFIGIYGPEPVENIVGEEDDYTNPLAAASDGAHNHVPSTSIGNTHN